MKKSKAFPNLQFSSQENYFTFIDAHPGYYGGGAYELKKKLDRESKIKLLDQH